MEREPDLSREFHHAEVLKVGILRFPRPSPSFFKNKGLLEKAGEYFVTEARPELTLLVKLRVKTKEANRNAVWPSYKEEKFLWTWGKEDTEAIEEFLRTRAVGMCRHTEKENPESRAALGVCPRNECDILKVEELLKKYLSKASSFEERNDRFVKLAAEFPVKREIVLFDPDFEKINCGQMLAYAPKTKRIRHMLNSNGENFQVFSVVLETESKVEVVKNAMRPLLLQGKRGHARRAFILQFIADKDSDKIADWWKTINASVKGYSGREWNKELAQVYDPCPGDTDLLREVECGFPQDNELLRLNNIKLKRDQRITSDPGLRMEVLEAEMKSEQSWKEFFNFLVRKTDDENGRYCIERGIFDAIVAVMDSGNVEELSIMVDPVQEYEKYGADKQTMLVDAVATGTIQEVDFVTPMKEVLGAVLFGRTKPFSSPYKEVRVPMSFQMQKSFYMIYGGEDDQSREIGFNVVWESVKENSGLHQLKIKVENLEEEGFRSKISIRICANAQKLYGEKMLERRTDLGTNWGKGILQNLVRGLENVA